MENFTIPCARNMRKISKRAKAREYKETYACLLPTIKKLIVEVYRAAQDGETSFYKDISREEFDAYRFIEKVMNKKGYRMTVWSHHNFTNDNIPWISVEW